MKNFRQFLKVLIPISISILVNSKSFSQIKDTVNVAVVSDSISYKTERQALLKRWEEVQKLKLINEIWEEESEMLMGPINFLKRIEKTGEKATERDKKFARAGISIIDKREWLPELRPLALKSRQLLAFIECCL